jgi:hypothetical protein
MELLNQTLELLQTVPYDTVIQSLAAAGVLSVLLQKIKTWFELQSDAVINFLLGGLSAVAALIQYLTTAVSQSPEIIPGRALGLMSVAVLVYHTPYIGVKALTGVLHDVKAVRASKAAKTEFAEVPLDSVQPQFPVYGPSTVEAVSPVTPDEFAG